MPQEPDDREYTPDESRLKTSFRECIPLFIALGDSTRLAIIQQLYEVEEDRRSLETEQKGGPQRIRKTPRSGSQRERNHRKNQSFPSGCLPSSEDPEGFGADRCGKTRRLQLLPSDQPVCHRPASQIKRGAAAEFQ